MIDNVDITSSRYVIYAILKSLNPSSNKELIRLSKDMAKKIDKIKDDLLDTAGRLKAIEEDKMFNLPPYLLIENTKDQFELWVLKITKFYEYILNKIDEVNSGKVLDLKDLEEFIPNKKKILAEAGLLPKLRLIRKSIPFKDVAENYTKVINGIDSILVSINTLYKFVEIFDDILQSFLSSSISTNTVETLEEFSNAQLFNLFTQYNFKLNGTHFLTYSTKKAVDSFRLYKGVLEEYNKQIRRGGGL